MIQAKQPNDSLRRRYLAKLMANFSALLVSFSVSVMVPRSLGPQAFGDFSFVTNFFTALLPFLTLSTSAAFFTKLSQRQSDTSLVSFYAFFTAFAMLATFGIIIVCEWLGLTSTFWLNLSTTTIYMGATYAVLLWLTNLLSQMGDAYGLTVPVEVMRIAQRVIGLLIIVGLFFSGSLNLNSYFVYHFAIAVFFIAATVAVIVRSRALQQIGWRLSKNQFKTYTLEFYSYSKPLLFYALVGVIAENLDRWLLQRFGGSIEQGFFGLASSVGGISFVFSSAITALIMREFAIAHEKGNLQELRRLYQRFVPLSYSITAYFGCFLSLQGGAITQVFGGDSFSGAVVPMMIMTLYPIHQTYGQLNGSLFCATGRTSQYSKIGSIALMCSLIAGYFAIAPRSLWGLDGGAVGLALKTVIWQFFFVNVFFYFNCKYLDLKYRPFLIHQLVCLGVLLSLSLLAKLAVDSLIFAVIPNFITAGLFYSLTVLGLVLLTPQTFGVQRDDLKLIYSKLARK